jgi:hypothetical protein
MSGKATSLHLDFSRICCPSPPVYLFAVRTYLSRLPAPNTARVLNTLLFKHGTHRADVFVAANQSAKPLSELSDPRSRLKGRTPRGLFSSINLPFALCSDGDQGLNVFT